MVDRIKVDSSDTTYISTITTNLSKITVSQSTFGSVYPKVVFDIFNTNTSGSSNSCKISFSV